MRAPAITQRVFDREEAIYRHLHAELRKVRAKAGATNASIPLNVPRMYYGCIDQATEDIRKKIKTDYNAVVVLENLKAQGFAMADKLVGCTFKEAQATLNSLANFHAIGMVMLRQRKTSDGDYNLPDSIKFIREKLMFDDMGPAMLGPTIPAYVKAVKQLGHPEAAAWLEKQAEELNVILPPEDVRKCGPLATILHGDCWNNNMMYRTDDEGNVQMRLIDWQVTRLGHAVTDCLHFLFNSTSPEIRATHFYELMDCYFSTLCGALRKLGVDLEQEGYTNKDFRQDIRKRLRWALFFCLMMMPGMLDKTMIDEAGNYNEDDADRLKTEGRKAEDDLLEMSEKWGKMIQADRIIANKLLSHRLVQTVLEVKKALES